VGVAVPPSAFAVVVAQINAEVGGGLEREQDRNPAGVGLLVRVGRGQGQVGAATTVVCEREAGVCAEIA